MIEKRRKKKGGGGGEGFWSLKETLCGLSSDMWFGNSRRRKTTMHFPSSYSSSSSPLEAVVLLVLVSFVLQTWVCEEYYKAEAIRILPEKNSLEGYWLEKSNFHTSNKASKVNLFYRYFKGRAVGFNRTEEGFEESKRRVPSCPDPLHN